MSETVFFLDTNVILQCKNLEELPWSEVTAAETIRLVLPGIVCDQLDRLKNDGSSRRAKRARKASSRCDEILDSKDQKIVIRKSAPAVTLELAAGPKPKQTDFPDLDLSYDDDRLIAETLSFRRANDGLDVRLLTDDVGPKMTAKRHGLPYTSIPSEGWLLAAESDPRDKELAKLREENERLSSEYASVEVSLETEDGEDLDKIAIELPRYRPLEQMQVDELINAAKARFPSKTAPGQGLTVYQLGNLHHAVRNAYDREYVVWEQDLQVFLVGLHQELNARDQRKKIAFVLDCNGVRPAEEVTVAITVTGSILVQHFDKVRPSEAGIILAPKPPNLGSPKDPARRPFATGLGYIDKTNPYVFHYLGRAEPSSDLLYTCREFSHHREPEKLSFILMPHGDANPVCNGSLACRVTARNLACAVLEDSGVSITFADKATLPLAERLIEEITLD
jgi:PIN domain